MKYIIIILLLFIGCSHPGDNKPELSNDIFKIEYNNQLHSRIISNLPDAKLLMNDFSPSEQLRLANIIIQDFTLADVKHYQEDNFIGMTLTGNYSDGKIQIKKIIKAEIQKDFPDFLITTVTYTNTGSDTITVNGWTNNSYSILPAKDIYTCILVISGRII